MEESNTNEEVQQKDKRITHFIEEHDFGWKITSKNINKMNVHGGATTTPTCIKNNNACALFKDAEEENEEDIEEEKEHECVKSGSIRWDENKHKL